MTDNNNGGIDLSNYLKSSKKTIRANEPTDEEKRRKKNKIYLAIIFACLLLMAVLWSYYLSQGNIL